MTAFIDSFVARVINELEACLIRDRYVVHGVSVDLVTDSETIRNDLREDYAYFCSTGSPSSEPNVQLYAFTSCSERIQIPDGAVLCSRSPGFDLYLSGDHYFLKSKETHVCGIIDLTGTIFVAYGSQSPIFCELMHNAFESCAFKNLEKMGVHRLHASAVADDSDAGILFPAVTLGGKTTAFFCALKAGLKYLTDDACLVKREGSRMKVTAFPSRLGADRDLIRRFPEIAPLLKRRPFTYSTGVKKWLFSVEEFFPDSLLPDCEPRILLFPRLWWSENSKLENMKKVEAAQELTRIFLEPAFLRFDLSRETRIEKFDLSSDIAGSTDCHRLYMGRNPQKVIEILYDLTAG